MYVVALTRSNANAAMVFQFLYTLVDIFKGYFGPKLNEDTIRNNFTLVYELLDEVLDFGYPQTTTLDILQMFINLGEVTRPQDAAEQAKMTDTITGTRDWRQEGIVYKKNQVFIDVMENVNLLVSSTGTVLRSDVTGQILMDSQLSGMPECKFSLNDKLLLQRHPRARGASSAAAVELDDATFHRCVQLGKFDADRSITFVPPDGQFELMRYRISENVNLPFRFLPVMEEQGDTRVIVNVKVTANFASTLFATNVVVKIPTPPNTARARITVPSGRARYEPEQNAIVWRVRRFAGGNEMTIQADVELIRQTKKRTWVRPPIGVDFQVPMFTASGLAVKGLKVYERSNYKPIKWVRYITRAGSYQIRI